MSGGEPIPAPAPGDVVIIDQRAGPHLAGPHLGGPLRLRVGSVERSVTMAGWAWLHGYQLNDVDEAVERRSVFVELAGLYRPPGAQPPPTPWRR